MKILVHDYAGHPFQVHLSRQLASRGHDVTHAYFTDDPGPKGSLQRCETDPPTLRFAGISISRSYDKTSMMARRFGDLEYGRRAAALINELRPDVVISGNTPTEAQTPIIRASKKVGAGFVHWLQDFYSIAVSKLLQKRFGLAGRPIGWYYRWLERRQLQDSDAVVIITNDFRRIASRWAGSDEKVYTIENWAALEEIPVMSKDNVWSREHNMHSDFSFIYSGTLALKHNPELLRKLAEACSPGTAVTVVAQGVGTKQLEAARAERERGTLKLLPLQPAARLAEVLASADVLVAVIEADAGSFSVPSKVQSYLCAARPILLAAPAGNLAARVILREDAGLVVPPDDESAFLAAAARLHDDPELRARQGANGRAYAERSFNVVKIADLFEAILVKAAHGSRHRTSTPIGRVPSNQPIAPAGDQGSYTTQPKPAGNPITGLPVARTKIS